MAARKNKVKLSENWKERIRTSMLLNRLNNHALGEEEMSSTQVDAAKYLLNKIISNAPTQNEHSGPDGKPISANLKIEFVKAAASV